MRRPAVPESAGEREDQAANQDSAPAANVLLAERYWILAAKPLPELDAPGAKAYEAADLQSPSNRMFARVCQPSSLPRRELLVPLRQTRDINMMRPIEWGAVEWPPLKRACFAVLFERPEHVPLVLPGATSFPALSVADLTGKVVAPAALALAQLSRRGIAYRALRPENLYGGGKGSRILLGECVTSPVASGQPAAYEFIEMAMTPPLGRGPGTLANDLYALGATVMTLALGRVPFPGLDANAIVAQKLARGSFAALLGGERVPFGLREVLRGLLADDLKARWGLAELQQWLSGGANKSVPDHSDTLTDRPFSIGGRECWGFRDAADAMGHDWRAASRIILDESFMKWAKRGLGDADLALALGKALDDARRDAGPNGAAADRLVTQVCAVLDPTGPMRYKGVVAAPDGLGPLLAEAIRTDDREAGQRICEVLAKGLPIERLVGPNGSENAEIAVKIRPFRQLQQLLRHSGPGYGRERCLYELNPHMPCQSKAVEGAYVVTAAELLPALDRTVRDKGGLPTLFDRHLAAFVASRVKRNFDRDLAALEQLKGDTGETKLAMLRILAWLQQEYGPPNLRHLADWLGKELDGAAGRFSSRAMRTLARQRLDAVVGSGDLTAILNALSDRTLVERDAVGRRRALAQYRTAEREILQIESGRGIDTAGQAGWRLAATVAWLCALGSVLVTAIV